jgi:putative hydrolase of the HAD superfamily
MPSPFKILTFDTIGTIIDYETGIIDYFRKHVDHESLGISDNQLLRIYAEAETELHRLSPISSWMEMLPHIYRLMAQSSDIPHNEELAFGIREAAPFFPAFEDSIEAMKRLRKNHRLVTLTNGGRRAINQMAITLENPYDDIITVEDTLVNKPDPQAFAYMRGRQSHLGYQLSDYLHVAQSQYHDIGIAKKLGYTTAWIERRAGKEGYGATPDPAEFTEPNYRFTSLKELADWLDSFD